MMPLTPYERMGLLAEDASMKACLDTLMLIAGHEDKRDDGTRLVLAHPANSTAVYEMWPYVEPMPYYGDLREMSCGVNHGGYTHSYIKRQGLDNEE